MIHATYTYPRGTMTELQSAVFARLLRHEISSVLRIRNARISEGLELTVSVTDGKKSFPNFEIFIQSIAADLRISGKLRNAVREAAAEISK